MAKSVFSKFNTLIQANVRGTLRVAGRMKPSGEPGKEIAGLRRQYETAQHEQEAGEQLIAALDEEILKLDAQADDALRAGRDAEARHTIEQIERKKRERVMVQAERDALQRALAQLFAQLNQLEALAETATPDAPAQQSLSDAIRQARQVAESTRRIQVKVEDEEDIPEDAEAVEMELAARRARLAKPD